MNVVILQGRMAQDPEVRYVGDNKAVLNFTIAVDRRGRDAGTDFFDCTAWDRTAENIAKFFHKGENIAVSGKLQRSSYTKRDGSKAYTTDVIVQEFDFCEKKHDR